MTLFQPLLQFMQRCTHVSPALAATTVVAASTNSTQSILGCRDVRIQRSSSSEKQQDYGESSVQIRPKISMCCASVSPMTPGAISLPLKKPPPEPVDSS